MRTAAIQTEALTRRYDDFVAVDQLTLTVDQGEIFGFLGHNGAGKTTTMSILTTLLLPTSGRAEVLGFDVEKENLNVRQRIGYVPEQVRLYNELTVGENLAYFAALSGVTNIAQRIQEVLTLVGHPEWQNRRVGSLSKGMRQRIGISQALMHQPKVLFLDEPSSGLDPEGRREIRDLITELNRQVGITIFMNTHELSEVTKICTSIGILNHGHLMTADSLENMMARFPDAASLEEVYLHYGEHEIAQLSV
jgi:ABC-2 type transport system ATP-binding protein